MGGGVSAPPSVRRQRTNHQLSDPAALRCRVTLRNGRTVSGEVPAERHRALQLWMLHRETAGLVELTPGTRDLEGRLHVDRRSRPEHYPIVATLDSVHDQALDARLDLSDSSVIRGEDLSYTIVNTGTDRLICGVGYRLERQDKGEWIAMNLRTAFRAIGFILAPGEERQLRAAIPPTARAGQYRISTSVRRVPPPAAPLSLDISALFRIG